MSKDINRYSFSRFKTFQTCPRKHNYNYIEQIETEESATTIPGKLFHQCVEYIMKGMDITPILDEFRNLCLTGKLDLETDLLEFVVAEYFQYYAKEFAKETSIYIEKEYQDTLDGEDYLVMVVDEVYRDASGYITVRDRKTTINKLKYTLDDVTFNQQLYLYLPYVEEDLKEKVDCVEIDEIRLAKLQPVPLLKSGKPSTNKGLLDLVTYEAYYDALATMGLETEREYQPILDWLRQRGHPLFNRVKVQVLDSNIVSSNAQDMLDTYQATKTGLAYRVKGPLCNYCSFKELCQLDYSMQTLLERDMIIQKISKS